MLPPLGGSSRCFTPALQLTPFCTARSTAASTSREPAKSKSDQIVDLFVSLIEKGTHKDIEQLYEKYPKQLKQAMHIFQEKQFSVEGSPF